MLYERGLLSVVDGGGALTGRVLWAVMEPDDVARIRVEGEGTVFRPHDPGWGDARLDVGVDPDEYWNPYYFAQGTAACLPVSA